MFINFMKKVFEQLLNENFNVVSQDFSKNIDNKTTQISLYKRDGSTYYFITLINNENYNEEETLVFENNIVNKFIKYRETLSKVIVLKIFIGNKKIESVETTMKVDNPFVDQFIYDVVWQVTEENGKIKIKSRKGQPNNFLNIKGVLNRSFKECQKNIVDEKTKVSDFWINATKNQRLKIKQNKPYGTYFLIMCILVTGLMVFVESGDIKNIDILIKYGALSNSMVVDDGEYFRIINSIFLHAGSVHMLSNLFGILIFGSRVERYMGTISLMYIFLVGGIAGNIATIYLVEGISVGASGGVFALIGGLTGMSLMYKRSVGEIDYQTYLIFVLINVAVGLNISNINNVAHMSGLVFGVIYGVSYSLINLKLKKRGI